MKILLAAHYLIVLLTLTRLSHGIEMTSLRQENEVVQPHIRQFIPNFTINTNDLDKATSNQLKDIKLGEIKTSYAHITSSTVSISQYGSERHIQYINPLKVRVINDTFVTFVIFSVHVLHTVGGKNYTCNVSIPLTYVNYVKEINLETGDFIITSLNTTFSSKIFSQAKCKESQTGKDKTRIQEIVNSTQGSSIYLQLTKTFSKLQEYFTTNSKGEHLSQLFQTNPYVYQLYDYKISINVSTLQALKYGQTGIQNWILGSIPGTSKAASSPLVAEPDYSLFFTIEFMQNMITYSKSNYPKWKNIKLNRSNMRNNAFKYRLLDFQYIIPRVLYKFPQNYLSDVEFECNIETLYDLIIDEVNVTQKIDWRCTGSFQVSAGKRETFLNFVASMKHMIKITASTSLTVFVDSLIMTGLNFDIINDYQIIDPQLFQFFLSQGLYLFKVYTIGTYFKVPPPNRPVKLVPNKGIWIG